LEAVLLHRPGAELDAVIDADAALMLSRPDQVIAAREHDDLVEAYRASGVDVACVDPPVTPPPNQMFVADLMFMTPAGAIVGRPASTIRAGEERWVARRLADLGIPVLRTVAGRGTFEGADAAWIDPQTVLLATGLRTNEEGAAQIAATLRELGVETIPVRLPSGTMHLMGQLRFLDRDLAIARRGSVPEHALALLARRGYTVLFFPDEAEIKNGFAHNFVTLGPRRVVMPAANPVTEAFFGAHGVECVTVPMRELLRAAGGIGCLTGILRRA
jgi:arginine deiminase